MASFSEQAQEGVRQLTRTSFLAAYHGIEQTRTCSRSRADYAGDRFIAYSTWRWLEAQVGTGGAPVYRYFLDLGSSGGQVPHAWRWGAFPFRRY